MLCFTTIIRNAESSLAACLDSVTGLADKIVIVDTGSTDRSVAIARRYTQHVLHFDWCDNFALARNQALQHIDADWILTLDADEVLLNPEALRQALQDMDPQSAPWVCQFVFLQGEPPEQKRTLKRALWSGHFGLRFDGRVHEYLSWQGGEPRYHDLRQVQVSHASPEPALQLSKQRGYGQLIQAELQQDQPGPRRQAELWWHLAQAQTQVGDNTAANKASLKAVQALQAAGPKAQIFDYTVILQALASRLDQQKYAAARVLAQQATQLLPRQAEGWFYLAWLQFWQGDIQQALQQLKAARQCQAHQGQHLQLTLAQLSFQLDWLEIRLLAAQNKTQAAIARLEPLYFQSQALELLLFRIFLALGMQDQASAHHWTQAWKPELQTTQAIQNALLQQPLWSPAERARLKAI